MPSKATLREVPKLQCGTGESPVQISPNAQSVFFDSAPVYSCSHGTISITLTTRRWLPDGQGGVTADAVVTGFLHYSVPAALSLKAAVEKAALTTQLIPGEPN